MREMALAMDETVKDSLQALDVEELRRKYWEQGEFLALEHLFPPAVIDELVAEANQVRPFVNRNYIPGHKKGGSVSYYILTEQAPATIALYRSPALVAFLNDLTSESLLRCPDDDPHACALYWYTEPGDHIGYHYDTSYYKGARYTLLIGLVDRSTSRLECRLHTKDPQRESQDLSLATPPGSFVFFNGDLLYHAVTPLGKGEERVVLTLQFVTNPEMTPVKRWFSNLKDAVGYFGLPALIRRAPRLSTPR